MAEQGHSSPAAAQQPAGRRVVECRRRGTAVAAFAVAAALCLEAASGFAVSSGFVARPRASPRVGTLSRHGPSWIGLRCSLDVGADAEGPGAKGQRIGATAKQPLPSAGSAAPITPAQRAVDKLVESTRQIGIATRGVVASEDMNGHVVGEWASWLNDNCPSDLTSTLAALTDERASHRKSAVSRLLKSCAAAEGKAAASAGSWAFHALAARLNDDSAAVREAAVKGLGSIAEKGNRNVVLAMATLIEEEKTITVRTAALQVISRVAQRGDQEALAPVLNLLRRVEGAERGEFFTPKLTSEINRRAVRAVSSLADPGNEGAIKALLLRVMDDSTPAGLLLLFRTVPARSAGPPLSQSAVFGASWGCWCHGACPCDSGSSFATARQRWLCVMVVCVQGGACERQLARSPLTRVMHAGVAVREEAVKGLASIACPSNPHVIQALSMSCEDEDECVRRAAMRNLRLLLKRQEAKQVCCHARAVCPPSSCDGVACVFTR